MTIAHHYTSLYGFRGIIESDCLWATGTDFLNDKLEMRFGGARFLEQVLENCPYPEKLDKNKDRDPLIEFGLSKLSHLCENQSISFVTSMCVHSDPLTQKFGSLSQWRAYGGGFALGYDLDACVQLWQSEAKKWHISSSTGQVLYDALPTAQMEFIERNQDGLVSLIADSWGEHNEEAAIELLKNMLSAATFVKHPGFHEEQEYRFFKMLPLGKKDEHSINIINYINRDGILVPYIEGLRGVNGSALKEVIIGPGDVEVSAIGSLELYLRKHGLQDVEVRTCPYPLR